MTQLANLIVRHPKAIITATLIITLAGLAVIVVRGISFNGSPETLARKDQTFDFYNETRSIFGDDRVIVVAVTTGDVFTAEFLRRLDRLTTRLAGVAGVDQAISLTNVRAIRREHGAVRVGRVIGSGSLFQPDDAELTRLRNELTRDPLYARHYVSVDGRTAAVGVFLKPLDESESRVVAEQVELVAKSEADGDEVFLSGVPILDARGIRSMLRDMLVLSPAAALLCFVVFLLAFRTWWGAMLPMSALLIGLIWTIALMSLFGRPITLATLALPTTMMAVGSSYIFHVLNQYRISMQSLNSGGRRRSKRIAWIDGLAFIGPAVIVSGTATAAGFGALASSTVPTARDMGIFEALGVLALLLVTVAFIPASLALLPRSALGRASSTQTDYVRWLNRTLSSITALVLFRRRGVLLATFAATMLVGVGAVWLKVNTDYLRIFPSGSETVRDAEKMHERLAGAATVQLVVTGVAGSVMDPKFINATRDLEQFSLTLEGVDAAVSVADIIGRINAVLTDAPDRLASIIPTDPARLASIVNDYLSNDALVSRLASPDGSRAVVILRVNLFSSNELQRLTRRIQAWSARNLPAGVTARATGSIILLNDSSDAVAASQSSSLAIALVAIYLMMVMLFRSFATGLLALLPNLLPIICYFGVLGWTGTPLDITSSLVASAVLGLAVDNAVHMIRRYRQSVAERRLSSSDADAGGSNDEGWVMWLTMLRTGKPMVLANGMLIAAFLIFVLSSFVPVRIAGLLWAGGIAACLVSDLILLPVLMKTKLFARAALGRDL
jgi:predicted RND superfamily exporter protein